MTKRRELPSQKELNELLAYDKDSGKLCWVSRDPKIAAGWNTRWAGKEALTASSANGHLIGSVNGQLFMAHRVIWKMVYGTEPANIDHINGDGADNRLSNLRAVTHQENCKNMKINVTNTSGQAGVGWHGQFGKWRAYITVDGAQKSLGLFDRKEDAIAARQEAEIAFGFHENHGRKSAA